MVSYYKNRSFNCALVKMQHTGLTDRGEKSHFQTRCFSRSNCVRLLQELNIHNPLPAYSLHRDAALTAVLSVLQCDAALGAIPLSLTGSLCPSSKACLVITSCAL